MQSPLNSATKNNFNRVNGVGFELLYQKFGRKYEISEGHKYIRFTQYRDLIKIKEEIFEIVNSQNLMKEVEHIKWNNSGYPCGKYKITNSKMNNDKSRKYIQLTEKVGYGMVRNFYYVKEVKKHEI